MLLLYLHWNLAAQPYVFDCIRNQHRLPLAPASRRVRETPAVEHDRARAIQAQQRGFAGGVGLGLAIGIGERVVFHFDARAVPQKDSLPRALIQGPRDGAGAHGRLEAVALNAGVVHADQADRGTAGAGERIPCDDKALDGRDGVP